MVSTYCGEPPNQYVPVTFGQNIGYLEGGSFRSFTFGRGAPADAESVERFRASIEGVALPFIEQRRDLRVLASEFASPRTRMSEEAAYRRPIVLRLLGDDAGAASAVAAWEGQLGERHDPAAERYRRFAAAFRATA
jgi:hypothetical protein